MTFLISARPHCCDVSATQLQLTQIKAANDDLRDFLAHGKYAGSLDVGSPIDLSSPRSPWRTKPVRWQNRMSWMFVALVVAAVIGVTVHSTEIGRFQAIARSARPAWLLAAIALQAGTYLAPAGVWWAGLWHRGQRFSFFSLGPLKIFDAAGRS